MDKNHPLYKLNDRQIILASGSPRRSELLSQLGLKFFVRPLQNFDESYPNNVPANNVALYIAQRKADAITPTTNEIIITADTIVIAGGEVLGKPVDQVQAKAMLRGLSGTAHDVVTGVAIKSQDRSVNFSVLSTVSFAPLTESEIDYYVSTYNPVDKAGAYGIQEWIGLMGIDRIEGSFYNVMGLPVRRLYAELLRF